ncbi:hypothetical protein CDCA_CDCA19G4656 [Cyanidium caldarium]|uniref:Uncharacterized protein n=1 Tax=Cyanidium caldarium TaxID=2771 RepID=A0AAV9J2V9_CYACA|nr:hypothetical protein CDCA_CDCA19G4656 [Cyanidium caldarium]
MFDFLRRPRKPNRSNTPLYDTSGHLQVSDMYDDTHLGYESVPSRAPAYTVEEPDEEAERSSALAREAMPEWNWRESDALAPWEGTDSPALFTEPFSLLRGMMTDMDAVFQNMERQFEALHRSFGAPGNWSEGGGTSCTSQSTRTVRRQRSDGTVYEETVTTRHLPNGEVEEVRSVRDSGTGENRSVTERRGESVPRRALRAKGRSGPRIEELGDGKPI